MEVFKRRKRRPSAKFNYVLAFGADSCEIHPFLERWFTGFNRYSWRSEPCRHLSEKCPLAVTHSLGNSGKQACSRRTFAAASWKALSFRLLKNMTHSTPMPLTFAQLGLAEPILRALTDKKYATPSPIQAEAIPHLLAGKDLMGSAQTGTGKTAAFALPILQRLSASLLPRTPRSPRALILTPTRELAVQIATSFADYGKYFNCATLSFMAASVRAPKFMRSPRAWTSPSPRRAGCSTLPNRAT